jgi:hypothetical protein
MFLSIAALVLLLVYCGANPPPQAEQQDHYLVKVSQQGQLMKSWQGPWRCVHDKRSGLLWEVKSDSENIHDGYWTYSWLDQQGRGKANFGDCYFESDRCDVQDLIIKTNQQQTCGRNNWRLPTATELSSLLDNTVKAGDPLINKSFFPHSKRGDYWTAEGEQPLTGVYAYLEKGAKAVNFGSGETLTLPYRNAAFLRLVSASKDKE